MIKKITEIIDVSNISLPFKKAIEKAVFEKSPSIQRVKPTQEKKKYLVSKNNINPVKNIVALMPFIQHVETLKKQYNIPISVEILHAGISVKTIVGKKKKNIFSLRHPRFHNHDVHSSLMLNCINNEKDLSKVIGNDNEFDVLNHENYFKILDISLSQINEIINYDSITAMITICNRMQNEFKKRKNVK